jgi:AraC-like DNA-binding protein
LLPRDDDGIVVVRGAMSSELSTFQMADAKHWLSRFLARCEPLGAKTGSSAVVWSLSGMKQLVAESADPLKPTECLVLAGVIAHLLESTIRGARVTSAEPMELAEAHRDVVAFMERCAWAAAIPAPTETSDPRIDRALRYMREQFRSADLSLGTVARTVGLTGSYLGRMLVQCTGRRFCQHLHELRMREARRLLVVTTLSVKEVAAGVGYNDATQFCRQFKRSYQTSPGGFRRAARAAS